MNLRDWRERAGLSRLEVADRIRRTVETVRRYEEGTRIPDRETMPVIVEATAGLVTPNDFFGVVNAPIEGLPDSILSDQSQRVLLCEFCKERPEDPAVRACTAPDCPHRQEHAA